MMQRNPFTPSFGKVPPHLAGRQDVLDAMKEAFDNGPGDPNLSSILIGARGTGKTALLACIADEARQHGWVVASTTAVPGMLEDLLERSADAASHIVATDKKAKITAVSIGQLFGVEFDRPAVQPGNFRTRMSTLLNALEEADVGLLLTVDEVRADLEEMVKLSAVYQHFVQEDRKVALVMAGLPYQTSSLTSDKSVSFLRRAKQHQLGRIGDADVELAMRQTITDAGKNVTQEALDAAVEAIVGFAFMIQLVGYFAWAQSSDGDIGVDEMNRGIRLARKELKESVFEPTYRELSPVDIRFLEAMLQLGGEGTLAEIARAMGEKSNYASKYKSRLLKQGVIGDRGHNHLSIDLPGFLDYLEDRA